MFRFGFVFVVMLAALGAHATFATAATSGVVGETVAMPSCTDNTLGTDGVRRQHVNADVNGGLSGIPPRVAASFGPGESGSVCIGFQNTTGHPIDLVFTKTDVSVDDNGVPLIGVENATYGASSWIQLPARRARKLTQGEIAWLVVKVKVPIDATPGSWYSNITATADEPVVNSSSSQVFASPAVAVEIFFDVPGEGRRGGVIQRARAPHFIWWDGLDIGRVKLLEQLRGLSLATIHFEWQNRGSYSDAIKARIVIRSAITHRQVATIDVPSNIVLRGATRAFQGTWEDDLPPMGRFIPTIEVTGIDGKITKQELPAIWVIPSWLYLCALAVALAIPIWARIRSRRRYRELLERLDAAEARATDDSEDWVDERY